MIYYIQQNCPICHYGSVGFRICSDKETIVLMCDECDSIWLDPADISCSNVTYPTSPDFKIPNLNCSVKSPISSWANKEEIEKYGWKAAIDRSGEEFD